MVGSLESLLSATAVDAVTSTRHDSNRELIGQGLGNMAAACFGGVPSTGAPMRGVPTIDMSGARVLQQLGHGKLGKAKLFLSGVASDGALADWLRRAGVASCIPLDHWFNSLDRALEAAEEMLLDHADAAEPDELPIEALGVIGRLSEVERQRVVACLQRRAYGAGEMIFRQGEDCDGLYLLVGGCVEIILPGADGQTEVRLATFGPGTVLGELALLDGGPRSADAVAITPAIAYCLSIADFDLLRRDHSQVATRFVMNIAKELADRLRLTNALLQQAE